MPKWLTDLTSSQWWAASRHYITFGFGILAGLGVLTVAQQHDSLAAIDDIASGLTKIATGVGTLLTVFVPIVNGYIAAHKASPVSNIQTVQAIATDPAHPDTADAKVALLTAVASMPEVTGKITLKDKALAKDVPSRKVV